MTFNNLILLAVGLVIAAALGWAALSASRRRSAALAAAGVAATGHRRRLSGLWFIIAGVAVLAVAIAGPAVNVPVSHARGTVIVAIDVSGSMTATDVSPNRLSAAKKAAQAFINAQPSSVDVGVVAFEQGGLEAAVPTADHAAAAAAIGRLSPGGGTSLGAAIIAALSAITHRTIVIGANFTELPNIGFWPSATIVLFSDGQDGGAGSASGGGASGASAGGGTETDTAAAVAQQAGVHIDTVGVGTTTGTTVDVEGYHLFTGLDEGSLKAISQTTGGSYHPASNTSELNGIASSIDLRLTVTNQPYPLAGAFIALALLLLAAGALLTVFRTGRVI
ncbi:MAG TPA: VWA domain-containing protein [Trebonia sp.]|nr:VWA domain-containing protein [Trebonia sp.]